MAGATDFTPILRFIAPVLLGWTAWVVWRSPYPATANRVLATFLGVVAVGFGFEAVWDMARSTLPELAVPVRRVQEFLGLVDPPLLLAFALVFPRMHRRELFVGLGAFYLAYAILLWITVVEAPWGQQSLYRTLHILYVNGTYLVSFILLLGGFMREERRYLARQLWFLALGVGFAALSRSGAFFFTGGPFEGPSFTYQSTRSLLTSLGILVVVQIGMQSWRRPGDRSITGLMGWMVGLLAFLHIIWYLAWLVSENTAYAGLWSTFYGMRWIVFAFVVGWGMLRYRLFDFDLRTRQAGAMLTATGLGALVGILSASAILDRGADLFAGRAAGLALGVTVGVPGYYLAVWLIDRWGPNRPRMLERRHYLEVYQATLEYALEKADWTEEERRFVETLREVFDVTPEEHEQVLADVRGRRLQAAMH